MGHVVEELGVMGGLAPVEAVLVLEADHELVHERHAEPRDLNEARLPGQRGIRRRGSRAQRQRPRIRAASAGGVPASREARRRPRPDHRPGAGQEAGNRHLEDEGGDVLAGEGVLLGVARAQGVGVVDQVERLAEVHDEGVLPLPDEHPSLARAAWDADREDVLAGVRLVVGDRLVPDPVHGLREDALAGVGVDDWLDRARQARSAHERQGEGFEYVQVARVARADLARLDEGNGHGLPRSLRTDLEGDVPAPHLEAEDEGKVLAGVAVVVHLE